MVTETHAWPRRAERFRSTLIDAPTDAASLAAFRISFGAVMAVAMIRFVAKGWVTELYVTPAHHITWDLLPWVAPLPSAALFCLFGALIAAAIGIAVGWRYRWSAAVFCAGFTYVELIDKTTYLNHYYLVSLIATLLVVMPADRVWSIDAARGGTPNARVPAWTINLLRFQLAVVYVCAGLAKLNADWLLQGEPLRTWLAARSDLPLAGPWLLHPLAPYIAAWSGAAYDLSVVFLLAFRRTRALAFALVVLFHLATAILFPIGMFPWIMIALTPIFCDPSWPRRLFRRESTAVEVIGERRLGRVGVVLIAAYVAVQVAMPLRAYLPGADPDWTGDGFNFAWRVMLVEKSGAMSLTARHPASGREWPVPIAEYLTPRQQRAVAQDPYMIRALARLVARDLAQRGFDGVEIYADAYASLNGRPLQRLVDNHLDLTAASLTGWIVPRDPRRDELALALEPAARRWSGSRGLP